MLLKQRQLPQEWWVPNMAGLALSQCDECRHIRPHASGAPHYQNEHIACGYS